MNVVRAIHGDYGDRPFCRRGGKRGVTVRRFRREFECSWEGPLSIEAKSPQHKGNSTQPQLQLLHIQRNAQQRSPNIAKRFSARAQTVKCCTAHILSQSAETGHWKNANFLSIGRAAFDSGANRLIRLAEADLLRRQ
jgi:hypothetical protein